MDPLMAENIPQRIDDATDDEVTEREQHRDAWSSQSGRTSLRT